MRERGKLAKQPFFRKSESRDLLSENKFCRNKQGGSLEQTNENLPLIRKFMVVVNLQTLNPSTIQLDVYTGKYGIHIPQKTTIMSFSHISKNKITTQKKKTGKREWYYPSTDE